MNEQDIISRYTSGETIEQISKEYQCTRDKIRWTLKKHGALVLRKQYKCDLPEQEIVDLYKNDWHIDDIAKKFEVSLSPIVSILTKHKVRKPVWLKTLPYKTAQLVLDKEWFLEVVDRCISKEAVAREIGCSKSLELINSLFKYHGIKSLSAADVRSLLMRKNAEYEFTKENVYKLYIDDRLTLEEISQKVKVSNGYLRKKMKEWCIDIKKAGESRLSNEFIDVRDGKEKLQELYDKLVGIRELAKYLNVDKEILIRTLEDNRIERIKLGEEYGRFKNGIIERRKETSLEKYGTEYPQQKHNPQAFELLSNSNWLYEQYILKRKPAYKISKELGTSGSGIICRYLRMHNIELRAKERFSYKAIQWLEFISSKEGIYIQHAGNDGEYKVLGTNYFVDGYCRKNNTIYEFYGDYWHANPHIQKYKKYNNRYEKTITKENKIKSLGYNLIIIWENEWDLKKSL